MRILYYILALVALLLLACSPIACYEEATMAFDKYSDRHSVQDKFPDFYKNMSAYLKGNMKTCAGK